MFKITGPSTNEKVKLNIENLDKLTQQGITKAFYKIGNDLKRDTKKEILKKPKHGRVYVINGRLHRASAPGEAPANLTGALQKAVDFDVVGSNRLDFGVRKKVEYGKFLELGTRKMEPRPYLLATIKKNFSKIRTHFEDQIKDSIEDKEI